MIFIFSFVFCLLGFFSVLEIGVGSGVILSYVGLLLSGKCQLFGTDINPKAAKAAQKTIINNKVKQTWKTNRKYNTM